MLRVHAKFFVHGGFQLEFVSISRVIIQVPSLVEFFFKSPLQDLLSSLNAVISTNESTRIITGHVIYDPTYTYKFQLKTTKVERKFLFSPKKNFLQT